MVSGDAFVEWLDLSRPCSFRIFLEKFIDAKLELSGFGGID